MNTYSHTTSSQGSGASKKGGGLEEPEVEMQQSRCSDEFTVLTTYTRSAQDEARQNASMVCGGGHEAPPQLRNY